MATGIVTVATHDLSTGIAVGVLLSGAFFAFKVTRMMAVASTYDGMTDMRAYTVAGQIFFASADIFSQANSLCATPPPMSAWT
ncbi:hypothetical protein PX699_14785 [Sphingobium sp. H39-3-25]|uniref:hypothetical protein n=1 Tax=Sphingobium arseniciresistens TaxID=3030834 RepID=UPI0023B89327|nr:hypothetical protein [Sphingobium arseniciresistens]